MTSPLRVLNPGHIATHERPSNNVENKGNTTDITGSLETN